jgi:zinc transporter 1/2/3
MFLKLIVLFSLFTPIGITLGILVNGQSPIVEGLFLALSTGTFIYVACSEVIVEEFAITKYKYIKYIVYILGAIFVGALAVWEALSDDDDH